MRRALVPFVCLGWLIALSVAAPTALAAPTLTVDTFEDTFDGSCVDGDCSLRDAAVAVDNGGTVRLPPGFYPLSLAGPGGPEAGDVDLSRPVTIVGVGETGSFLDASALGDRVFDVAADASLRHLTLLGGSQVGTGGIVRATAGSLNLSRTTIFGGRAGDGGPAVAGPSSFAGRRSFPGRPSPAITPPEGALPSWLRSSRSPSTTPRSRGTWPSEVGASE
jgi:CSLREA domain-containing protein